MPGSPATSPRVGAPRYSDADAVSFASQVNGITDAFDAAVALLGQAEATVSTKNANYTAAPGDLVLATAAITVTLPTAPPTGSSVLVVAEGGAVTISRAGTDTITNYSSSGNTTLAVPQGTLTRLRYLSGAWHVTQSAQSGGGDVSGLLTNLTVNTWGGQSKAAVVAGNPPQAHEATHQPGGSDALVGLTDASIAAANKDGTDATASMRTLGVTAGKAVGGDRAGWQGVTKNTAFTAVVGQMNYVTGAQTATLPAAPADDVECGIVSLTGTVTVARGGANTIDDYGLSGLTSVLVPAGAQLVLKYLGGVWYVVRDSRPIGWWSASKLRASFTPVTTGAVTKAALNATDYDNGGFADLANNQYKTKVAGFFRAHGSFFLSGYAPIISVLIFKNGVQVNDGWGQLSDSTNGVGAVHVVCDVQLAVNDTLDCRYTCSTGGTGASAFMSVERFA